MGAAVSCEHDVSVRVASKAIGVLHGFMAILVRRCYEYRDALRELLQTQSARADWQTHAGGFRSCSRDFQSPETRMRSVLIKIDRIRLQLENQAKVEPTGVEPVSALGIDLPFIHRFSSSNPQSGNHPLSRMVGCSSRVLTH